ncbi:MAG: FxDxF family PEP-CTERM protein [Duganella sp.]
MKLLNVMRTAALAISFSVLGMSSAVAGANGDTIKATYYFPTITSQYHEFGTVVVGSGDTFLDPQGDFQLTITDTQIIADHFTSATSWSPARFNGLVLTNLTKNFSSYTLDSATNMPGFGLSNFSVAGNILSINWQGLSFYPDTQVVLNISAISAVPEPETYALLLAGLGLMGAVARRRKSRA